MKSELLVIADQHEMCIRDSPKWETVTERKTVNSMVPIWQRSKKDVSDEDCAQYY